MTAMTDPAFTQVSFRWRNDDGSQTAATWQAATNTNISKVWAVGDTVRLRVLVRQTVASANQNLTRAYKLRVSIDTGTYVDIAAIGSATAVRYASSANVSDGNATTQQIGSGSFLAGVIDNNNTTGNLTWSGAQNQETELEFVLSLNSEYLSNATTLDFRVYETSNTALTNYTTTPRATVSVAAYEADEDAGVAAMPVAGGPVAGDRILGPGIAAEVTGDGAVTIPTLLVSGSATRTVPVYLGDGSIDLPALNVDGIGDHVAPVYLGDGAVAIPALAVEGDAAHVVPTYAGDGDVTISALETEGQGASAVPAYAGAGEVELPALTVDGDAAHVIPTYSGEGDVDLPALIVDGSGEITGHAAGDGEVDLPALIVDGDAAHVVPIYAGAGEVDLPHLVTQGTATSILPDAIIANGVVILPAIAAEGQGESIVPVYAGAGEVDLPALTVDGSGEITGHAIGDGAVAIPELEASGSGEHVAPVYQANGAVELPMVVAEGDATNDAPVYSGDGATTMPSLSVAGNVTIIPPAYAGSGAASMPPLQAAGSGNYLAAIEYIGAGDIVLPGMVAAGEAFFWQPVPSLDPWTAAWQEAQASVPSNKVPLYTLELLHPSFGGERFRLVNDTQDHTLLLEENAPLDGGQSVLFTAVPFFMPWPEQEEGRVPELTIRIDNVGREVVPFMADAVTSFAPIQVILRVYLWNADTGETEAGIDPIRFPLRSITVTDTYIEGVASPADLANLRAMRQVYDLANYPGMGV